MEQKQKPLDVGSHVTSIPDWRSTLNDYLSTPEDIQKVWNYIEQLEWEVQRLTSEVGAREYEIYKLEKEFLWKDDNASEVSDR